MEIINFFKSFISNSKKSLFIKIFLISTITSLLSVAIIGTYTYYYILGNLDISIDKYEQKKLDETLGTSKILLGEMQKLIMSYAINYRFTQLAYVPRENVNERYLEIQSLQESMSNTINSSNYIENIFIYYEKGNYILDYSGIMPLSQYYDTGWYDAYSSMKDTSAILDARKIKVRSNSTSDRYNNVITFITKIPYSSASRDGVIVLNVDTRLISDLLKNITSGYPQALAFLVNNEGRILSSNNEQYYYQDIYDTLGIKPETLGIEAGSFRSVFNKTNMLSYFESSSINGWKLIYMQPENIIFQRSVYIKTITFAILFVLLLLTMIISLYFSLKVYNPIKKIIAGIREATAVKDEGISDLSLIGGSLDALYRNNKLLEKQLEQNKILIRENFFNQLITGRLFNKNEIKTKAEYFAVDLDFSYFKVIVIQNNSIQKVPYDVQKFEYDKVQIITMLTQVFNSLNIEVICSQDSNDNILALLGLHAEMPLKEYEAIIEQTLEDIKDNLKAYHELLINIGIGGSSTELSGAGASYKEAVKALHYKFLRGENTIISYEDISQGEKEKLYYPVESEQKLISLIKASDYEKAVLCLNDMLEDVMSRNSNFAHLEACISNMSGIVRKCLIESSLSPREILGEEALNNISINEFKNVQHFSEWMSDNFRKIIDYLNDQKKDNNKSIASEITDYLNTVYMEEISLASVADHFNYNSSYFCKIFKEKMGVSFWEYVANIRMEHSKQLLNETDYTIEQIAKLVGYNNRFSYIRTFKKCTAVTPTDYRLQHQQRHVAG